MLIKYNGDRRLETEGLPIDECPHLVSSDGVHPKLMRRVDGRIVAGTRTIQRMAESVDSGQGVR